MQNSKSIEKQLIKTREAFIKIRQIEINFEKGDFSEIDFFIQYSGQYALDYALEWTAFYGKIDLVKKVLDAGANIHSNNDAALLMACENSHLDIVSYLLSMGADINANNAGPLFNAVSRNHIDVTKFLLEYKDTNGKNICNVNDNCAIALRIAIEYGYYDICKLLIKHGADIYVCDDLPLSLAKRKGYTNIVDLLEKNS